MALVGSRDIPHPAQGLVDRGQLLLLSPLLPTGLPRPVTPDQQSTEITARVYVPVRQHRSIERTAPTTVPVS